MFEDIEVLEKEVASFRSRIAETEQFVQLVNNLLQETKGLTEKTLSECKRIQADVEKTAVVCLDEIKGATTTTTAQLTSTAADASKEIGSMAERIANASDAATKSIQDSADKAVQLIHADVEGANNKTSAEIADMIERIRSASKESVSEIQRSKESAESLANVLVQKIETALATYTQQQQIATSQVEKVLSVTTESEMRKIENCTEEANRKITSETNRSIEELHTTVKKNEEMALKWQADMKSSTEKAIKTISDVAASLEKELGEIKAATKAKMTLSTIMASLAFATAAASLIYQIIK